jgi:ribosome biogenesis protein UTP30
MKKHATNAPSNLQADEREDIVLLQLLLRRIPVTPTTRPRLLSLPHPIITHSATSVCVISDKSKSLHFPISKDILFSKLRSDYRTYESRHRLIGSHDLFIVYRAILPQPPCH